MSTEPADVNKAPLEGVHAPIAGILPIDPAPPEPATFDFTVSSLTVKNPRSLLEDSDFATLNINVVAADNTVIQQYPPVTQSLGGLGKNLSINPKMSVTGIAVPDGASMIVSFIVLNKGAWDWDSTAISALELAGSAVLGAVVQGSIVAPAGTLSAATIASGGTATAVPFIWAAAVTAAIISTLEAVNILIADCDGTVVAGPITLGKTELLQYATPGPWQLNYEYPGTDSADGCGANSDYLVTYSVEATPPAVVVPKVAVPNITGMLIANGLVALREVGLVGIEKVITSATDVPNIVGQTPAAGTLVPVSSEVQYEVKAHPVITHPLGKG